MTLENVHTFTINYGPVKSQGEGAFKRVFFGLTDGGGLGEIYTDRTGWEQEAEFIVRAVNSHEALLSVLKRFMDFDGCYAGGEKMDALDFSMNIANLHKQAREAIAQAEGVQS